MPQPRPTVPTSIAAAVAAQGLRLDQVDPDHLYYLQHVRNDGNSYALDLPARSKSPPATVNYEPETPAANGEAQSALVPSTPPAGSGRRVVAKEITPPPTGVLPWYETRPMDEDYRKFWRQACIVDGKLVLPVGEDKVLRYGVDAVPVRLTDIADWAEKIGWALKKGGEEVPAVAALGEDRGGAGVGEKKKLVPIRKDGPALKWGQKKGGEELAAVAALGEDGGGVRVGEKKKVPPIRKDGPALESRVRDSLGGSQKKKVEQGQVEKGEGKGGAEKIKVVKRKEEMLNELPVETLNTVNKETNSSDGHDAKPHSASACVAPGQKVEHGQEEKGEGKGGAGKIKVVKRKEETLNEMPVETLNTVNKETNSSSGHDVKPHSASGFHGVVWPIHIMERPESSFKKKLLCVLRKPFSMVEYKEKLDDATINRPATKIRQTRGGVKYYDSEHERNQSYFDSYPDLAKQVESTSYPNQLALLRGFYFWLQNVTDEDQFRPWSDDFRQYTIIPLE